MTQTQSLRLLLLTFLFSLGTFIACGDLDGEESCDPEVDGAACICTDEEGEFCTPTGESFEDCACFFDSSDDGTGTNTGGTSNPGATSNAVTISEFTFSPQAISIRVGGTVTWTNSDMVQHNISSDAAGLDETLEQGESYTHTFSRAGTFTISNRLHEAPGLTNHTVTVTN